MQLLDDENVESMRNNESLRQKEAFFYTKASNERGNATVAGKKHLKR